MPCHKKYKACILCDFWLCAKQESKVNLLLCLVSHLTCSFNKNQQMATLSFIFLKVLRCSFSAPVASVRLRISLTDVVPSWWRRLFSLPLSSSLLLQCNIFMDFMNVSTSIASIQLNLKCSAQTGGLVLFT